MDIMKTIGFLTWFYSNLHVGLATNFSPEGDPYNPSPHGACAHRDLTNQDIGIAHQTLPCMSKVWIYNPRTKRTVIASVMDRGPRKAALDLLPATAKILKANGWETVLWAPLK